MMGLLKKTKLCLDKCDFHWLAKDNERGPVIMCAFLFTVVVSIAVPPDDNLEPKSG